MLNISDKCCCTAGTGTSSWSSVWKQSSWQWADLPWHLPCQRFLVTRLDAALPPSLQLFKQNLFCFTLAARLGVMLQVWDNGRDQREQGRFPSLQYEEHPLCTISLVHYDWNSKRAWPQHVGLLQSHILTATYPLADGYMPCIIKV